MATLRERLTPQEQQRFRQLYSQGYFSNEIVLNRFIQRLGRELRFIDYRRQQLERDGWPYENLGERPQLPFTNPLTKHQIQQMRAKAFDTALQGERALFDRFFTGERTRQDLQDLDRALGARPDGTLLPKDAGLFAETAADKSIAERAWDKYWQEKGLIRGTLDVAASMLTGPIRGAQQLSTGSLGENPLEAVAEIGSMLPIGRAAGRLARPGSLAARAVRSPLWTIPSYTAQVSDIVGAGEDAYLELLAEAGFEAIGSGGDLVRHLRNTRGGRIFGGLDPQAAEDAQTVLH